MSSPTERDDWVLRLSSPDPAVRDPSIIELRELLLRALRSSLTDRYGRTFDPEDIVQVAVLKVLDSLEQFEGRSRFTTWATTIAMRVGISELRRRHYKDVSLDAMSSDGEGLKFDLLDPKAGSPDQKHACQAVLRQLRELIDTKLTAKQQQAMRGALEGLPVDELARRFSSNRNAVYKLIHDARSKLRDGMEQAGFMMDEIATACA